jgi:hypothetical protein
VPVIQMRYLSLLRSEYPASKKNVSKQVVMELRDSGPVGVSRQCETRGFYLAHIARNHLLYVCVYNPNPLCQPPHVLNDKLRQLDRHYMPLGFFQLPK